MCSLQTFQTKPKKSQPLWKMLQRFYKKFKNRIPTWSNGLAQNWERNMSRLFIVTLLI